MQRVFYCGELYEKQSGNKIEGTKYTQHKRSNNITCINLDRDTSPKKLRLPAQLLKIEKPDPLIISYLKFVQKTTIYSWPPCHGVSTTQDPPPMPGPHGFQLQNPKGNR